MGTRTRAGGSREGRPPIAVAPYAGATISDGEPERLRWSDRRFTQSVVKEARREKTAAVHVLAVDARDGEPPYALYIGSHHGGNRADWEERYRQARAYGWTGLLLSHPTDTIHEARRLATTLIEETQPELNLFRARQRPGKDRGEPHSNGTAEREHTAALTTLRQRAWVRELLQAGRDLAGGIAAAGVVAGIADGCGGEPVLGWSIGLAGATCISAAMMISGSDPRESRARRLLHHGLWRTGTVSATVGIVLGAGWEPSLLAAGTAAAAAATLGTAARRAGAGRPIGTAEHKRP